jgi:hypothetical protein
MKILFALDSQQPNSKGENNEAQDIDLYPSARRPNRLHRQKGRH